MQLTRMQGVNLMKRKWPLIVIAAVMLLVSTGLFIWWYLATNALRNYEQDIYKLELLSKRQQLEMAVMKQSDDLQKMQREARRIKPSYQSQE
jgi:hypothetical protein